MICSWSAIQRLYLKIWIWDLFSKLRVLSCRPTPYQTLKKWVENFKLGRSSDRSSPPPVYEVTPTKYLGSYTRGKGSQPICGNVQHFRSLYFWYICFILLTHLRLLFWSELFWKVMEGIAGIARYYLLSPESPWSHQSTVLCVTWVEQGGSVYKCLILSSLLLCHTSCPTKYLTLSLSTYPWMAILHFSGTEGNFIDIYINNW